MKILYFDQYYPPEKASGLNLVQDLLEGFANAGWEVSMYVPTPTRGVTKDVRKYYKKRKIERLHNGNVVVHRISLFRESKNVLARAVRYFIFSIKCFFKTLSENADIVFTGSGPPTQGWIIGNACRLTGKKLVFNLQDIFPDSLVTSGICSENSVLMKVGRRIENKTYNNATHIITITDDMRRNVLNKGVPEQKVSVVQNWIDTEKVRPVKRKDNKLFDDLKLPKDKFYVTYAGNIGKVQGIDTLIESAELLKEENVHFVIFGNGSEEESIKKAVKGKNLHNVSLFPLQPIERVSEVYSLGDVNFISCKPGTGSSGMPSKTWTIMACGSPIIASFDLGGEMENTLKNAQCGVCVQAGQPDKVAEAIRNLKNNEPHRMSMGLNARICAEEHASKPKCVGKYVKIISDVDAYDKCGTRKTC